VIGLLLAFQLAHGAGGHPPATPPVAAPDAVATALRAEVDRAMALRLPGSPPVFHVAARHDGARQVTVLARNGALLTRDTAPVSALRVEVTLGDGQANTALVEDWEASGIRTASLPMDAPAEVLRRGAWRLLDAAWKGAVELYARLEATRRKGTAPRHAAWSPAPVVRTGPTAAPPAPDAAWIEALARAVSAAARVDPRITADVDATVQAGVRTLATSEGTLHAEVVERVAVRLTAIVQLPDGATEGGSRTWVVPRPGALPAQDALVAEARAMGTHLRALVDAPVLESWLGPVIFEGPAAVELFSQLLAPELSGTPTAVQESDSAPPTPRARLGRRVLPHGWSVEDDAPGHPGLPGATERDDEGVAPRRVELVRDGVIRDVLMTRVPREDRAGSTGHARGLRGDLLQAMPRAVLVTPPNLGSPARLDRRALREAAAVGLDRVLVIGRLTPLSLASEGAPTRPEEVWLQDAAGRRTPVRGLRFTGADRRALRDLVAASPGEGWTTLLDGPPDRRRGMAATDGIPVSWNVPRVLVGEMELAGAGGGEARVLPFADGPLGAAAP
jgi:predicted Zn-dependent protease